MLSDEDIDTITSLATQEQGYSSFTFADEKDADKEIIDVIKKDGIVIDRSQQMLTAADPLQGDLRSPGVARQERHRRS